MLSTLIEQVVEGTTKRFNCPSCGGSNTLTITKSMGKIVYNCFRANCSLSGKKKNTMTGTQVLNVLRHVPEEANWQMPEYWVGGIANQDVYDYLVRTHTLSSYDAGLFDIAYDPSENRVCYLIKDNNGAIVNAVGRALKNAYPKSRTYAISTTPFSVCTDRKYTVVVEDCASAVSASRHPHVGGLALLGTHLHESYVAPIALLERPVIALDYDAMRKTLKMQWRLYNYNKRTSTAILPKDIKDMTDEEYIEWVNTYVDI